MTQDKAVIEAIGKVRDGYVSQMKFCDIEALGYFREFVRRIDDALAKRAPALASGTPTQRAETTGSVGEADGGPPGRPTNAAHPVSRKDEK